MDLKVYYAKIREAMAAMPGEFAVVVSRETPDGGKAGVKTEASSQVAARMLVEGRARLATPEEAAEFYKTENDLRLKARQESAPPRLQVAVLTEKELETLKGAADRKASRDK